MNHHYKHSCDALRHTLNLEPNFKTVSEQFFNIANTQDFTDQCHILTNPKELIDVFLWLSGMDQIASDNANRNSVTKKSLPIHSESSPNLKIEVIKKLQDSDLCHGWGYHNENIIVFFFFMMDQKGLVIRANMESSMVDFFRLTALQNAVN